MDDFMHYHYIETSKGMVYGDVENEKFIPTEEGYGILKKLFVMEYDTYAELVEIGMDVIDGWVKIPLSDGYYGSPEYRIHTLYYKVTFRNGEMILLQSGAV